MINVRTSLYVLPIWTMSGRQYINDILLPHVRMFRGAVGENFVFVYDNATCHRTVAVYECVESEDIQRL